MTDKIKEKLDKWSSLIRFATPLGVAMILLLQTKFVTKDEIKQIQIEIVKINTSLALLAERGLRNDRQDKDIQVLKDKQQELEVNIAKIK